MTPSGPRQVKVRRFRNRTGVAPSASAVGVHHEATEKNVEVALTSPHTRDTELGDPRAPTSATLVKHNYHSDTRRHNCVQSRRAKRVPPNLHVADTVAVANAPGPVYSSKRADLGADTAGIVAICGFEHLRNASARNDKPAR